MTDRRINKTPTEVPVLSIKGQDYPVAELPQDIQKLIKIYEKWQLELSDKKLEVFKQEAAIRGIEMEIELRISNLPGQA